MKKRRHSLIKTEKLKAAFSRFREYPFHPQNWPEPWRQAGVVFLTVRLISWLVGILSFSSFPADPTQFQAGYAPLPRSRPIELLFGIWERSDALWYLGISQGGYAKDPRSFVFMPFYPFLVHVFSKITPFSAIVSAIFVSNLCFFLGLGFLYQLVKSEFDTKTAQRTLWYVAFFPGSLFMLAPYSESTFFLLAVAALLAARKGRFWMAGLLGALLGLTRNLGTGILVPLLIEAIFFKKGQSFWRWDRNKFSRVVGALCASLGLLLWIAFLYWNTGDPLAFLHHQDNWQRQAGAPWMTLWGGLVQAWNFMMSFPGGIYIFDALSVSGALVLAIIGFMKLTPSWSAFTWICILPPLVNPYPGRMFMSCIRFISIIFPLFIVLALLARKDAVDQKIRLTLASAYGVAVALYVCNHYMF